MRSIIVQPTSRCYLSCPGCYNIRTKDNLSLRDLTNYLRFEYECDNVRKVSVSGGDPLLYPFIEDLVDELYSIGYTINLDTVGISLITEFSESKTKSILSRIDTIGIPLDGIDDLTIAFFRPNLSFKSVLEIISVLEHHNTRVCINTVLHKLNIPIILSLAELINKMSIIKQWQIFQYMPIGPQSLSTKEHLSISSEELYAVLNSLKAFPFRKDLKVEIKDTQHRIGEYVIICSNGQVRVPENDGFIGHIKEHHLLSELLMKSKEGDEYEWAK